jgi:transposase
MAKRKFVLSKAEQKELLRAYRICRDAGTRTRYQAVRLYCEGYSEKEIGRITGCSRTSLMEWCRAYRANPEVPLILFWDRAPWHRGQPIDHVLKENPRLEIIFFPTASPDLNPQEHVWKAVRKEVSHNHLEARLPALADRFLDKLNSGTFKSSLLDHYGYNALRPMFI